MLYLVNAATSHYDRLVAWHGRGEDIVFALEVFVQGFYLWRYKQTYGESFYEFKRSGLLKQKIYDSKNKPQVVYSKKELGLKLLLISLLFETVLPFIKTKL